MDRHRRQHSHDRRGFHDWPICEAVSNRVAMSSGPDAGFPIPRASQGYDEPLGSLCCTKWTQYGACTLVGRCSRKCQVPLIDGLGPGDEWLGELSGTCPAVSYKDAG